MGSDGVLMVKSMLDLRLLESYCPDRQEEEQEEQVEVRMLTETTTYQTLLKKKNT